MTLAEGIVFTNIPITQVILAVCAAIATIVTLITVFHKLATSALQKAVDDIKEDLKEINTSLTSLNVKVGMQNGRVGKLEDWRVNHSEQAGKMFDFIMKEIKGK